MSFFKLTQFNSGFSEDILILLGLLALPKILSKGNFANLPPQSLNQ